MDYRKINLREVRHSKEIGKKKQENNKRQERVSRGKEKYGRVKSLATIGFTKNREREKGEKYIETALLCTAQTCISL